MNKKLELRYNIFVKKVFSSHKRNKINLYFFSYNIAEVFISIFCHAGRKFGSFIDETELLVKVWVKY